MRFILPTLVGCVAICATCHAENVVTLEENPHSIKATIGEDVFAVFRFDKDRKKPFALPVTAPGGFEVLRAAEPSDEPGVAGRKIVIADETPQVKSEDGSKVELHVGDVVEVGEIVEDWLAIPEHNVWIHRSSVAPLVSTVTRLINDNPERVSDRKDPRYYDHPHHKGVWLSVDEINGIKFWNEDGAIVNQSVEVIESSGNPAVFRTVNHWVNSAGEPLLIETTKVSVSPQRLLTYDVTFTTPQESVEIGDTKEGMFAIRLPNSMREMVAGGPVVNADGVTGTGAAWGLESRWVDYRGPIDGHVWGVTLMDHPQNPWKSRYHVRNYGLFAINPFGAGAYTKGSAAAQPPHHRIFKQGESLNFKYGLFVHDDQTTTADIEEIYQLFAQ